MSLSGIGDMLSVGILNGGLYALMAAGLALILGVMSVANFAHGEFYLLGAYFGFFFTASLGLNPILGIIMAAVCAFVAGSLVERVLFYPLRKRSQEDWVLNTFLLTVGLSMVIQNGAQLIGGMKYRGIPQYWKGVVRVGGISMSVDRAVAFLISIAAIVALWLFLDRTRLGRAFRAVAQDEAGAALLGVNLHQIENLAFALSTALAGLAGASLLSITKAYPSMGATPLNMSWYVIILAGLGNIRGSIVSGFIVGLLQSVSYQFLGSGWPQALNLGLISLLLLLRPTGLFGTAVKD